MNYVCVIFPGTFVFIDSFPCLGACSFSVIVKPFGLADIVYFLKQLRACSLGSGHARRVCYREWAWIYSVIGEYLGTRAFMMTQPIR